MRSGFIESENWIHDNGMTWFAYISGRVIEQQFMRTNEVASVVSIVRIFVHHEQNMFLRFDTRSLALINFSTSAKVLHVLSSYIQKLLGCFLDLV